MTKYQRGSESRKADCDIEKIFLDRWSPRAMSGEEISDEELMTLFEAARWAPSSFNEQPWRFIYARKGAEGWDRLFGLLVEGNKIWCENGSVLCCVASRKTFTKNGKPHITHMFSAGSAWENLALQASSMGLVCHGMGGFDYERAKTELKVPDEYEVNMMFVLGRPGEKDILPEDLQNMEAPSLRKGLAEFVFEGEFKGD